MQLLLLITGIAKQVDQAEKCETLSAGIVVCSVETSLQKKVPVVLDCYLKNFYKHSTCSLGDSS